MKIHQILFYFHNPKKQIWLNKVTIRNGLIRSINVPAGEDSDNRNDWDQTLVNDLDFADRLKSDVSICNSFSKPPMIPKDFVIRSSKNSVLLKPQIGTNNSSSFTKLPSFIGSSPNFTTLKSIKPRENSEISLARIASKIWRDKDSINKSQSQNKIMQSTFELKPNLENSIMIDSKLSSTFWVEDEFKELKEVTPKLKGLNLKVISRNELQQKLTKIREESRNNSNNLSILKALTNPN